MAQQKINFKSPVGRIVMGSLYKPKTVDMDGNPLQIKKGPNKGQPRVEYFIGLAVPKTTVHWNQTTWGKQIWEFGHRILPTAGQSDDFAWKINDGDSQEINKYTKMRTCDREGFKNNWILKLANGYAPRIYILQNKKWELKEDVDFIKPGYFVEVSITLGDNESTINPGIYLNYDMVGFRAYGEEIYIGTDVETVGFGEDPLPHGASVTPVSSAVPLPTTDAPPPPIITPNKQFLTMPPPPPPKGPAMTDKANGITYNTFISSGWTDATLIAEGYMLV